MDGPMDGLGLGLLQPRTHNHTSPQGEVEPVSGSAAHQNDILVDAASNFINQLNWSAAKSIRTSIITLASFNVAAAFVTIACILWDRRSVAKKTNSALRRGTVHPLFLTPVHTYPFILSLAIVVQGIIFAVIQSRGLNGLLLRGCIPLSQAMMPATFIVPYIQVVFSLESASRAIRRNPFPPSQRWVVPGCIVITVLGLVGTHLATVLNRPPDACFADLFWFTQQWRVVSFGLFVSITGTLLICLCVIFVRLRQCPVSLAPHKLAASNMVYYTIVAMISNSLMIPFFVNITFGDLEASATQAMEVAMIASVVANLSGIMTGGLYLFLRGGRYSSAGKDADAALCDQEFEKGNQAEKSQGFEDSNGRQSFPPAPYSPSVYPPSGSRPQRAANGKRAISSTPFDGLLKSLRDTNGFFLSAQSPIESTPVPDVPVGPPKDQHQETRQRSFLAESIAPQSPGGYLLPAATYVPNQENIPLGLEPVDLLIPPPLHLPGSAGWHRRESSLGSSATVQIGLRLSNMGDAETAESQDTLRLETSAPRSPSPLSSVPSSRRSPSSFSDKDQQSAPDALLTDPRDKKLPDLPMTPSPGEKPRLEGSIYSPKTQSSRIRQASPKGVGFSQQVGRNSPSRLRGQKFSDNLSPIESAEWI